MHPDPELLTTAEQEAYRLVVRLAGAGPDELARLAGTSARQAADVLESLRAKGLVTPGPTFHALPPDVALGDTLLRQQQSLEAARQVVAALSEEYRTNTRRRS